MTRAAFSRGFSPSGSPDGRQALPSALETTGAEFTGIEGNLSSGIQELSDDLSEMPVLTTRIAAISSCVLLAVGNHAVAGPISRERVMAALPKLEALTQKTVDGGGVPGLSIAVVHHDKVV
jgi:hypothetical protein